MKHILEVCLVALALANVMPFTVAQRSTAAREYSFQTDTPMEEHHTMQKGITVELPVTSNAVSVPHADNQDSLIVTVTHEGSVYLGVTPIHPNELADKVKAALSNRTDRTLYVKVDARAPYASLIKVVDCAQAAGVEGLALLTADRNVHEPGALVPPRGFEMQISSPRLVHRRSSKSR